MASDAPLNYSEYRDFCELLNKGGYVLDFNDQQFNKFTSEFVGVGLKQKYGKSKGKSLEAFLSEASRSDSLPLLKALMDEWERTRRSGADERANELADSCRQQLSVLQSGLTDSGVGERLKSAGFTSDYLDEQRNLLWEKVSSHPTASIGTAKELIESCCKTILEQHNAEYLKTDNLPKLFGETQAALAIDPREVDPGLPDAKAIQALLGSLASVARHLAELRNGYGTGHGRSASYKGLSERHARLAAGAALTLVEFLWATHLAKAASGES